MTTKQSVSIRLSPETNQILQALVKHLGLSRDSTIAMCIRVQAGREGLTPTLEERLHAMEPGCEPC